MNDVVNITRAFDFAARKHTNLAVAGLLHDCVEDQGVRPEDLVDLFGSDVTDLVLEVTDDKNLEKDERKRLQVTETPHKSNRAKMLKMADKTSNLRSIAASPPKDWSAARRREYFEWAKAVVAGCGDASEVLKAQFDEAYRSGIA